MASRDPRIDAYIAKAAPFARPVLRHVRQLVHQGCPEVEETMKWSMPHFEYHGIMLGMAAFKEHCSIGFWKGELILGKPAGSDGWMGHFGRVTGLKDLPSDRQFIEYEQKAAATFDGFSYTNKREYLDWITEAKREETRSKRLQTAIAWIAQGKPRNWKYLNCDQSFSG